ncbi:MAG: hypothetical protein ACRC5H_01140, partial [Treponemataceae bacterium]
YFVVNPNPRDLQSLAERYKQKSFIYAHKGWGTNFSGSFMRIECFKKRSRKDAKYTKTNTSPEIRTDEEFLNYFNNLKDYRFLPSFSLFKLFQAADDFLLAKFGYDNMKNFNYLNIAKLKANIRESIRADETPSSRWRRRCFLFETNEDREKRITRLKETISKNIDVLIDDGSY